MDTNRKELIGNYKNAGRQWHKKGEPVLVNMQDFQGKAIPNGMYDIGRNEGWVNVGLSHDTAEFPVESIRRSWVRMGQPTDPNATEIPVSADGGGSNGARVRLWKLELQGLAGALGLALHVRHFPLGTKKWNRIEHRMFCHIRENWRGQPLLSRMAVVELIAATSTEQGLTIQAARSMRALVRPAGRSRTQRWPPSRSSAVTFTANGTIGSRRDNPVASFRSRYDA